MNIGYRDRNRSIAYDMDERAVDDVGIGYCSKPQQRWSGPGRPGNKVDHLPRRSVCSSSVQFTEYADSRPRGRRKPEDWNERDYRPSRASLFSGHKRSRHDVGSTVSAGESSDRKPDFNQSRSSKSKTFREEKDTSQNLRGHTSQKRKNETNKFRSVSKNPNTVLCKQLTDDLLSDGELSGSPADKTSGNKIMHDASRRPRSPFQKKNKSRAWEEHSSSVEKVNKNSRSCSTECDYRHCATDSKISPDTLLSSRNNLQSSKCTATSTSLIAEMCSNGYLQTPVVQKFRTQSCKEPAWSAGEHQQIPAGSTENASDAKISPDSSVISKSSSQSSRRISYATSLAAELRKKRKMLNGCDSKKQNISLNGSSYSENVLQNVLKDNGAVENEEFGICNSAFLSAVTKVETCVSNNVAYSCINETFDGVKSHSPPDVCSPDMAVPYVTNMSFTNSAAMSLTAGVLTAAHDIPLSRMSSPLPDWYENLSSHELLSIVL